MSKETLYVCPKCGEGFTCDEWDEVTVKLCINRKERRKYDKIEKNSLNTVYLCKGCDLMVRRDRIKIKEVEI